MIASLLALDFMNFTYRTHPCSGNVPVPAIMRKGSFTYVDPKIAQGFDLLVFKVTEGSLRAGTRQAVVVLTCDFPIGGTAEAYAFDERTAGAVLLARVASADWGGDWGSGPSAIRVRFANGRLEVEQCLDQQCSGTQHTTYTLTGGKLVAVATVTRPDLVKVRQARVEQLMGRAYVAEQRKDYAGAIAAYTEALHLDPQQYGLLFERGAANAEQRRFDAAIADYTAAIRLQPDAVYFDARGRAYAAKHEDARAMADYDEAIRRDQHRGDFLADRGNLEEEHGDHRRAIDDYSRAISLFAALWAKRVEDVKAFHPDPAEQQRELARWDFAPWADSLQSRAFAYSGVGRFADAIADCDAALAIVPRLPFALYVRGLAKYRTGDRTGGGADLAMAHRLDARLNTPAPKQRASPSP
jgi:hypothetical protein